MPTPATEKRKEQRAIARVFDAMERGRTPDGADLRRAGVCRSCYGFGYYYTSEERSHEDRRTKCKSCNGTGVPKTV